MVRFMIEDERSQSTKIQVYSGSQLDEVQKFVGAPNLAPLTCTLTVNDSFLKQNRQV
ncbi:hypothetical protein H1Q63_18140 [Desmonostoc muscorum CCALA 125]|uniref:Uncharacterized protein n=1 Tax=Desmonostoc muscorum LEGE 12446 TaxID=1828758 RepID=A0A8J6ZW70_DESMC|nr:hypothetical protein [Desmonostoc muscorum]MBX9255831.1 hypothetical protein [Desmonostoc muscorum CCALA 125]MCF2150464.1 hypothetical protein [Desmonostoc muscorum LEGE 12446]